MVPDQLGRVLHDKATRGLPLSETEQHQLEQWYAQKDQEEALILTPLQSISDQSSLQIKIDNTLLQIANLAKRMQEMMLENQSLRMEITNLRQQVITASLYKKAV